MFNWRNMNRLRDVRDFYTNVEGVSRLGGLRIWILQVLDNGPKNGAEIMDAIEELHEEFRNKLIDFHMQPFQRPGKPSPPRRPLPGSIYPMLKKMVAENLIFKQEDSRYDLTDLGKKTIHEIFGTPYSKMYRGESAIENAITEIDSYTSYLEDIKTEKLIPYEEQMKLFSERLEKIIKSLHKEN